MQVVEGQVSLAGRLAWLAVVDNKQGTDSYLCEVEDAKPGRQEAGQEGLASVFPG